MKGFLGIFFRFLEKKEDKGKKQATSERAAWEAAAGSRCGLSQILTFGAHMYRDGSEEVRVDFADDKRNIYRQIVDGQGRIVDFPGIVYDEVLKEYLETSEVSPVIRYRTEFARQPDGSYKMIWEVQPDGYYWSDEHGFGGTNDLEVCLYTYIDMDGKFTGPFRVYSVNGEKLAGPEDNSSKNQIGDAK